MERLCPLVFAKQSQVSGERTRTIMEAMSKVKMKEKHKLVPPVNLTILSITPFIYRIRCMIRDDYLIYSHSIDFLDALLYVLNSWIQLARVKYEDEWGV
ncbi:hypothetical protein ACJIZ3_003574 [Penstemon smallii]|uniref:Uncharacterized protein n=1 Tax=Penstemon smallii TaxID=265156 RepID=A0ABD3U9P6_9LAMI